MRYNKQLNEEDDIKLRRYVQEEWFEELNSITNLCDNEANENTKIQNIKDYVFIYMTTGREEEFSERIKELIQYMEAYKAEKNPEFLGKSEGKTFDINKDLLYISNGYHINGKAKFMNNARYVATNGMYSSGSYMGTDHKIYLAKRSMNSRKLPVSPENKKEVDYNSIMAQTLFEYFDEPVSEYYLMHKENSPCNIILTKNFLKNGQELIHLSDMYCKDEDVDTYSGRRKVIKRNLEMRYKNIIDNEKMQKLLEKVELQYCRQEFFKLLIGPMDSNPSNTALVLTSKKNEDIPDIDISPAFDLDLSFNVAEELSKIDEMNIVKNDRGETESLEGFIEEFKNIKGFEEFLESFYEKAKIEDISNIIVDMAYNKTNYDFFLQHSKEYKDFLNRRFDKIRRIYREQKNRNEGDKADEIVLE